MEFSNNLRLDENWRARRITMRLVACFAVSLMGVSAVRADSPEAMYIFPAGGQRGAEVRFRVGGLYLHDECPFEMLGPGMTAPEKITACETVWFEGPVIPLPDSQQSEDYPHDLAGTLKIATDAPLGARSWRLWTDQGATAARVFQVGELPEIVEDEIDGAPIPVALTLPVTVNGRIFPREDVDLWKFSAKKGEAITCVAYTSRLGSPFDARLEIQDQNGRRLAENSARPMAGTDASIRFIPPEDGEYQLAIHDVKSGGLQHYVYRVTITAGPYVDAVFPLGARRGTVTKFELTGANLPTEPQSLTLPAENISRWATGLGFEKQTDRRLTLDLDELPEFIEPVDSKDEPQELSAPFVGNGRILQPGEVDVWNVRCKKKGEIWEIDLRAARLGSPLDSVISVLNVAGQELALADDTVQTDSALRFTCPEEGVYRIRVEERNPSRGGKTFAYRLRVAPPAVPDFSLQLGNSALTVNRGSESKFKIRAIRVGAMNEPITLEFENLPVGVAVAPNAIAANASEVEVMFKAPADAPIAARTVRVRGKGTINGAEVVREASFVSASREETTTPTLLLAVAQPTPYKVKGVYEVKYAQRGGRFIRHFTIDRGGFTGPLKVKLADRQMRHLQGVKGSTIDVPAGASEFDFPIFLPPWMEIGRTSRTLVMAIGEVVDPDGSRHQVSFTSAAQNEQIVALIDPGQLSLDLESPTLAAAPASECELTVKVGRGQGVQIPVRIELIVPRHIKGVKAEPIVLKTDQQTGAIKLKFNEKEIGPFNKPLIVRATADRGSGDIVVAEASLDVVHAIDR